LKWAKGCDLFAVSAFVQLCMAMSNFANLYDSIKKGCSFYRFSITLGQYEMPKLEQHERVKPSLCGDFFG
tara:strand:+ start:117 stop:326 length:210 start_codon:yes stop_codon:yes gene_type:complete